MGKIARIAALLAAEAERQGPFPVVVSARGGTTDQLLELAAAAGGPDPAAREVDQLLSTGEIASAAQLALALGRCGVPAVSLTGTQAGINVSGPGGNGAVASIDTTRIQAELAAGKVVVVAGFQGVDAVGDVVTLGRGGSDTTAVALAVALGARRCEIYTDVDGVYTVDPRLVADAQILRHVDPDVMTEMAFAGSKVLHPRSAQLAATHGLELHVRDAAGGDSGTVVSRRPLETAPAVSAVACDPRVARVLIRSPHGRDLAPEVLEALSLHAIPVDLVARSGPAEEEFRMGFTIDAGNLDTVRRALREVADPRGATVVIDENVSKVSVVGPGIRARPAYIARITAVLAEAGIDISWVALSANRASVTVARDRRAEAVRLLHREFHADITASQSGGDDAEPLDTVEELKP
nr:aspartate kinase [Glycomyces sp. TRM65418]